MKTGGWIITVLTGLLLSLGGCMVPGTDELFALPRTSETYSNLQAKVQSVMGNAVGISPISGNNTQTLQLVDLDRDGIHEAVAFYRDNSAERPLKIAIFKQDETENYELYAKIEGAGTDIESIEYRNLTEDQTFEILVSWQASATVHTFVAYSIQQDQVAELMRSGYTRYLATDLNQDERAEVLLIQMDSDKPVGNRVELYQNNGSAMEFHSSAALSENLISLQLWETGYLANRIPSFLVTAEHAENQYITDIFAMGDTGLRNLTLNESSRVSDGTMRHHTGVLPTDINSDGATEIPITRSIPTYNSGGSAENFWAIDWLQFAADGSSRPVLSTYHNSNGWYLELPEHWLGKVTLSWVEDTAAGERGVLFSYWTGNNAIKPLPFLAIYRLTGNNRDNRATQDQRFPLWADPDTIYVAEFLEGGWDSGLDKESLLARFRIT